MKRIVLASKSPRRAYLLSQLELTFEVYNAEVDETIHISQTPAEAVLAVSRKKAEAAISEVTEDSLIISADTIVVSGGKILGKPESKEEAAYMLSCLSGSTHEVFTGVTLAFYNNGWKYDSFFERTEVTFRVLLKKEIEEYIETGEPMDKAGAYGIQGLGMRFVSGICGDFYNVVGLPVCRLYEKLRDMKAFG